MFEKADIDLIRTYKDGDVRSLGILWQRHYDYLHNLAMSKVNFHEVEAEDILQESFIKAKKSIDKGGYNTTMINTRSWLHTIVQNTAMDYHRGKHKIPSLQLSNSENDDDDEKYWRKYVGIHTDSIENQIIDEETVKQKLEQLNLVLDILNPKLRELVTLRFFHKKKYEEIAEILNLPLGTVKGYLHRAKEIMKDAMDNMESQKNESTINKDDEIIESKVRRRNNLTYSETKELLRPLCLKSTKEFTKLKFQNKLPNGVTRHPYQKFHPKGEWVSWEDFLSIGEHPIDNKESDNKEIIIASASLTKEEAIDALNKKIKESEITLLLEEAKLRGYREQLKIITVSYKLGLNTET